MGTSHSRLVRNLLWPEAADPGRIPTAGGVLVARLTANFKRTCVDLGHCDPIDAFVAADRLRLGRDLPAPFHYEERYFPVRLLTRYRCQAVNMSETWDQL